MRKTVCLFFSVLMLLLVSSCGEKPRGSDSTSIDPGYRDEGTKDVQIVSDDKTDDEAAYGEHTVWGYYPGEDGFTDCCITFHDAIVEDKTVPVIVRNSGGVPDEVRGIDITIIRLRPGSDVTVPINLESDNPAFSKAVCIGGGTILESGTYDIALGGFGEMEHLDGFFSGKAEDIVPDPNSLRMLHTSQFDTEFCLIMVESPAGTQSKTGVWTDASSHSVSVSAGYHHNGVLIDGDLYTWGDNDHGQLGDGTTEERSEPRRVDGLPEIKSICFAVDRSAAIAENGDLYTWGLSEGDSFRDGHENHVPVKTEGISNVQQIEINGSYCIALNDSGDVYTWEEGVSAPKRIEGLSHVKEVCIGLSDHMGAVTEDGTAYTWGRDYLSNEHGELGRKGPSLYGVVSVTEPAAVEGITNIADIDFGYEYSAAVTESGELYLWGRGSGGSAQVGDGTKSELHEPGRVPGIPPVKDVCLGRDMFAFITQDGMLFTWGENKYGSLGLGNGRDVYYRSPARVPEFTGVKEVSMGKEHGIFVTEENMVYAFGDNSDGQLGSDDRYYTPVPIVIDFFSDMMFPYGSTLQPESDTKVGQLSPSENAGADDGGVAMVSMGGLHSAAVTSGGYLYMWGDNENGQLGDGTVNTAFTPQIVPGLSKIKFVSLGSNHSAAIDQDGDLYTWGGNYYGQLGVGEIGDVRSPTKVPGLDNVKYVSLGTDHSGAITEDGKLYTWGNNEYGQLGDGTTESRNLPAEVTAISDVESICFGNGLSAAITTDHKLYVWGNNTYGYLGNGTKEIRLIPELIDSVPNVRSVCMEGENNALVTEEGDVYTWGSGSLGHTVSEYNEMLIPQKVPGLSNIKCVSVGYKRMGAVSETGDVYVWGDYMFGGLGDGTEERSPEPKLLVSAYERSIDKSGKFELP